ncbi:MAG: hypothetical protein AB1656_05020 [Candidatus Omnitrophota bacterium]
MKRGAIDHPKTKRLAKILGIQRCHAIGILEALWHFTAQHAIQGNVGRWSNEEIAEGVYWEGDSDTLLNALLKSGFVDPHPTHRLIIHDWHDHADDSVRKTLKNRNLIFLTVQEKSGMVPNDSGSFANGSDFSGNFAKSPESSDRVPEKSGTLPENSSDSPEDSRNIPTALPSLALPEPVPEPGPITRPPAPAREDDPPPPDFSKFQQPDLAQAIHRASRWRDWDQFASEIFRSQAEFPPEVWAEAAKRFIALPKPGTLTTLRKMCQEALSESLSAPLTGKRSSRASPERRPSEYDRRFAEAEKSKVTGEGESWLDRAIAEEREKQGLHPDDDEAMRKIDGW